MRAAAMKEFERLTQTAMASIIHLPKLAALKPS
jgi:hypothetical protein